jgi:CheY-like chemotaxis protein
MRKDNVEMVVPKAFEFVATDQGLTVAPEPYRPVVAHCRSPSSPAASMKRTPSPDEGKKRTSLGRLFDYCALVCGRPTSSCRSAYCSRLNSAIAHCSFQLIHLPSAERVSNSAQAFGQYGNVLGLGFAAHEALELLRYNSVDVRLIFSDVLMPGTVDEVALVRTVRSEFPVIKIMLTSANLTLSQTLRRGPNYQAHQDALRLRNACTVPLV